MVSAEVWLAVGVVLVGAGTALVESYRDGRIRDWLNSKESGDIAHEKVVEKLDKVDKLDDIEETVQCVDEKVGNIGEAIVVLHQDDEDVDESALREKVEVDDLSGDIVEGD
jgi:hypothetical protein